MLFSDTLPTLTDASVALAWLRSVASWVAQLATLIEENGLSTRTTRARGWCCSLCCPEEKVSKRRLVVDTADPDFIRELGVNVA